MSQLRWRQRLDSHLLVGETHRLAKATAGLAWVAAIASFWAVAGVPGVLAGLVVGALWYVLGTPYAVAAGTALLAATATEHWTALVIASAGFLALVLVPTVRTPEPRRYALGVVLTATVLLTGTLLLVQSMALWLAGTTLLVALALASYGLYRVSLLRLGLLGPTSQPEVSSDNSTARQRTPETPPGVEDNSD